MDTLDPSSNILLPAGETSAPDAGIGSSVEPVLSKRSLLCAIQDWMWNAQRTSQEMVSREATGLATRAELVQEPEDEWIRFSENDLQNRMPPRLTIVRKPLVTPEAKFQLQEQFDGIVTSVTDTSFETRFEAKLGDEKGPFEAEFPIDIVAEPDRHRLQVGAAFCFYIGRRTIGRTVRRQNVFYLRRQPPLSREDVEDGKRNARIMRDEVGWR